MTEAIRLSPQSLEHRLGWEIYAGGRWKTVIDVIAGGRSVLVVTEDRVPYRYERTDAVKVRPPEAEDQCDGADRP